MKAIKLAMSLLAATLFVASCDNHDDEDTSTNSWTSWAPGMVYCTNGEVMEYTKVSERGLTPEAVVFYVSKSSDVEVKALAVSLHDGDSVAYSDPDTTYIDQGAATDFLKLNGETNTIALRSATVSSPMVKSLESKYFIPSVQEMHEIFLQRMNLNMTLEKIGGQTIPNDEKTWYWTSTQSSYTNKQAWVFSMYSGGWLGLDKHRRYPTRPVISIRRN